MITFRDGLRGLKGCCKHMKASKERYSPQNGELAGTYSQNLSRFLGLFLPLSLRYSTNVYFPLRRDDVTTLLTKAGSNLTVKSLLDNLAITIEFEQSMSKKWATPVRFVTISS